jgi:hypothetical protein
MKKINLGVEELHLTENNHYHEELQTPQQTQRYFKNIKKLKNNEV